MALRILPAAGGPGNGSSSWESQEAIDAHHASPMMAKVAKLREKYDLHMRAERYLPDAEGVPDSDKKFLRS